MSYSYELDNIDPQKRLIAEARLYSTDNQGETLAVLQDEEFAVFLRDSHSSPKLAAALALEFIASRANLTLKKAKAGEVETDGPAMAKELRAQAATLRAQHKAELEEAETEMTNFYEVIEGASFYERLEGSGW